MKTSIPRLGKVTFKNGTTLHVIHSENDHRSDVERDFRTVIEMHCSEGYDIAGYALMIWASDNTSTCSVNTTGNIPSCVIPDFVRNRLLGQLIERWTIDTINHLDNKSS